MRLLAAIPFVMLAAAACAPPASAPRGPAGGTETVALTATHRAEWRVLWVEGTTDLPDGAMVNYRVTHAAARATPADQWPAANLIASGRAAVQDGGYWARVNTVNWPPGEVRIVVQFPLPPQPPAVVDRYGEFGEPLTGANVIDRDGIKMVEVEHTFEHQF